MFENIHSCSHDRQTDKALIFLHGLGASAGDVKPFIAALDFPGRENFQIILPQAPVQAVTLADGMPLAAWFDLFAIEKDAAEDAPGITRAADHLDDLLAALEKQGIARDRIVLGGFSQGGALALYYASRALPRLAGAIALSAYLPLRNTCPKADSAAPIFMAHGTQDEVLPIDFGRESCTILQQQGFEVCWHEYPTGHHLPRDLDGDLAAWLSRLSTV